MVEYNTPKCQNKRFHVTMGNNIKTKYTLLVRMLILILLSHNFKHSLSFIIRQTLLSSCRRVKLRYNVLANDSPPIYPLEGFLQRCSDLFSSNFLLLLRASLISSNHWNHNRPPPPPPPPPCLSFAFHFYIYHSPMRANQLLGLVCSSMSPHDCVCVCVPMWGKCT